MYHIVRTKNDNKTIIKDLGYMQEEDFIEFARQYIGKDTSEYGCVFSNERELLDDIEYIKQNGDEMWFEYKDTNLQIYYLKESGDYNDEKVKESEINEICSKS